MIRYCFALLAPIAAAAASCASVDAEPVRRGPTVYADRSVGGVSHGPLPDAFMAERRDGGVATVVARQGSAAGKFVISLEKMREERRARMISINARDITVAQAIGMIREVSKTNIALRPGVGAAKAAPLFLENVEWFEALETIVRANGLVASVRGEDMFAAPRASPLAGGNDVILISTYDDFLKSQDMRKASAGASIELARRRRQAVEEDYYATMLSDTGERETRSYRFKYADPLEAVAYLESLFADPSSDHSVKPAGQARSSDDRRVNGDSADREEPRFSGGSGDVNFAVFKAENLVTITAPARVMPEVIKRIEDIDVRPKQVYIEARIVEIQRNHIRDLGIQWGGHATKTTGYSFPDAVGVYGAGESSSGGAQGVSLPPASAVDPVTGAILKDAQGAVLGVTLGAASGSAVIQARLFALERAGASRTLSNPKVMAINGEKALIKSGREIPYQASSANTGVTIRFKEAVISLAVTPQIMEDDRIRLKIEAKKDEVDSNLSVQGTPAIKKKELATSAVVDNGGSAVLGGLFEGADGDYQNRVPWFHRVPVLGWLFKSDQKVDNELELLVFITPSIIEGDRN